MKFSDFGVDGWIHQIPHVIFETKSQLRITLQCHERQLFCTFLAKALYNLNKRSPSKCKISDLTAYVKFHQICTLIGSFCWKYIKFSRKSTEELCLMTLNSDATFEEKLICCFNWFFYFDLSPWKSPKFALWFLLCKVYNVWLKKV